ncbi:unnamed protein product, partial [Prunus brigantina]
KGLLSSIQQIHKNDYYHGGLQHGFMYVIIGRIKLFNVMNSLDGVQDREVMKLTDFSSFGDFVNTLLYGYQSWTNKDNFVLFFKLSGVNNFVQKLIDYPFLLTPSLRMKKINDIYQSKSPSARIRFWIRVDGNHLWLQYINFI